MQEAVRRMLAQDDGVVVNVASLAGRRGVSPLGGYCASKFALVSTGRSRRHAGWPAAGNPSARPATA
jgi:NAD(P)-dependent dehydrogenase (short-subunit alcohol dehydrogenase family)